MRFEIFLYQFCASWVWALFRHITLFLTFNNNSKNNISQTLYALYASEGWSRAASWPKAKIINILGDAAYPACTCPFHTLLQSPRYKMASQATLSELCVCLIFPNHLEPVHQRMSSIMGTRTCPRQMVHQHSAGLPRCWCLVAAARGPFPPDRPERKRWPWDHTLTLTWGSAALSTCFFLFLISVNKRGVKFVGREEGEAPVGTRPRIQEKRRYGESVCVVCTYSGAMRGLRGVFLGRG